MRFGVLPRAGGKLDQDPRFLEAVNVIEQEIVEGQKRKATKDTKRKELLKVLPKTG